MTDFKRHLIPKGTKIKDALVQLNELASDAILFVVDDSNKLIGSLTDGDVRRGLIKGIQIDAQVDDIIQSNPKFFKKGENNISEVINYRKNNYKIIPVVESDHTVVNVVNFRKKKSYLPIDAVIMAGGRGSRLRPLTDNTPKPLLKVGDKPIIEHNIDRLNSFGIDDLWLSIRYLGDQIKEYFDDGSQKGVNIQYVTESEPLGTIGAVKSIKNFKHDTVLVTNSDLLTDLDYEDFYMQFLESGADMSVVTIPYKVDIPYAVLETNDSQVHDFKEKPTYTYYSNGGIYLVKKSVLDLIPENEFFNATDLMEKLIKSSNKVHSYPLLGYWLDIGKHEDYNKAQQDIIKLKI
ncbi:nucleotidyltransferase family protein [Mangrovivirga sp. M17]|uniref:Nucleotidyltransferase family protein n=1 Tax=Mangrovivirga halotolerans TaxID=2993936 RepID=A0ABT3RTS4_9BACT|nr:nucleotidyltransferase family protein [Mangrovivirga halotolerans]MCX2745189.1 nucleotidyltransferase family protein [Mangrovivirga halotolerans]